MLYLSSASQKRVRFTHLQKSATLQKLQGYYGDRFLDKLAHLAEIAELDELEELAQ